MHRTRGARKSAGTPSGTSARVSPARMTTPAWALSCIRSRASTTGSGGSGRCQRVALIISSVFEMCAASGSTTPTALGALSWWFPRTYSWRPWTSTRTQRRHSLRRRGSSRSTTAWPRGTLPATWHSRRIAGVARVIGASSPSSGPPSPSPVRQRRLCLRRPLQRGSSRELMSSQRRPQRHQQRRPLGSSAPGAVARRRAGWASGCGV
mmetsp:Transcript_9934/g.22310  ORF Transcript_9934/g.22310 Transcript_9934/m.22310 type:complete len:208 (+) Transcript_9934:722-1345(+)